MFSVCADGSEVWHLWCPGCGGEFLFLYCDDVRLCCVYEMFEFLHGAPYAICVELKYFYFFVFWRYFVCFVCDNVRVWLVEW